MTSCSLRRLQGLADAGKARALGCLGATIMGRNMCGPIRGDWTDDEWKGLWGDDPPYHHPTFVLTHHVRESITMQGGTVFHFVTDGIEAALERAYAAADGQDVRLAGGVSAIQQYLRAGLVDECTWRTRRYCSAAANDSGTTSTTKRV